MTTKPLRSLLCIIPTLTMVGVLALSGCAASPGQTTPTGASADAGASLDDAVAGEGDLERAQQFAATDGPAHAQLSEPVPMTGETPADEEALAIDQSEKSIAAPAGDGRDRAATKSRRDKKKESESAGALATASTPASVTIPAPAPEPEFNTEAYDRVVENEYLAVADKPLSTFSIDVDTASYSNVRRFLESGQLPPADAVRVEELINYFSYDYEGPRGDEPFSVTTEVSDCPWNADARLVHVGIQGKQIDAHEVPARNMVFLLDVSGSMDSPDKLPLLKQAMSMVAESLRREDHISIVVYAGASGVVLEPTNNPREVERALERLSAGGSTNGGAGIELAYSLARQNFVRGGINRVILATDGDFNVGTTSQGDLERLIEDQRRSGVFLSVLGFGTGNVKDSTMEMLADKGNGNYAYIDTKREARKVLVEEASGTLVTIAKDVKIQVEFNPATVASYRLVGYENRALADQDFNDDTKDAGEIGAGHTVTALYEVIPVGRDSGTKVDPLRYQGGRQPASASASGELMFVKLRFKHPDGRDSKLSRFAIVDRGAPLADSSDDFRFAAAVAEYGMVLRDSQFKGSATMDHAHDLARRALGSDPGGHKREFVALVRKAERLGAGGSLAIAR